MPMSLSRPLAAMGFGGLLLSSTACGNSHGPDGTVARDYAYLSGTFCLVSRDGSRMPITVADSAGWQWKILESTLTLHAPGGVTFEQTPRVHTITAKVSPGGAQSFSERTDGLTYAMTGDTSFTLGGPTYLQGTGAIALTTHAGITDTAVIVSTAAGSTYGAHDWRYTPVPATTSCLYPSAAGARLVRQVVARAAQRRPGRPSRPFVQISTAAQPPVPARVYSGGRFADE